MIEGGIVQEMIKETSEKIAREKERVIELKLIEKGLSMEVIKDCSKSRFPRFIREVKGEEETYWYDDGSYEGLRIVTFKSTSSKIKGEGDAFNIFVKLEYY